VVQCPELALGSIPVDIDDFSGFQAWFDAEIGVS